MVTSGVVIIDELSEAGFQLTGQVVMLQQYPILHRAVVAFDLALGHRVIGPAAGMRHAMLREPGTELS